MAAIASRRCRRGAVARSTVARSTVARDASWLELAIAI
jgi:hypothetical protein